MTSGMDLASWLGSTPGRQGRLTHVEHLAAREADHVEWPGWAHPDVVGAFKARGVERPWRHQVIAADAAFSRAHVAISTGTASGKSMAYQLPALSEILEQRSERGQRGATVLYLAPTKALAQDQLSRIDALDLDVRAATHDGDAPREQREWTRAFGEFVLTNPDMLHRSMLPSHSAWASFWRKLRYVIVDECHHYRGVFGAHVAHVLRRLRRVAQFYGADPTFILASATMADPEVTAHRLTGLDVTAVTHDGSPRGKVTLGLWQPPLTAYTGEHGAPLRRAASSETADLLTDLVIAQVRTLAFIRSRAGVEQVALSTQQNLSEVDASLPSKVAAYRGGYLPEERRALETALRDGDLWGIAATNALELGIDVSGLDAVLIAGFPGTRAALWQQIGRAGRGAQDALGIMVARDDPLDTYLVTHPEALIGQPVEATVFDPTNPYVLAPHLCAAAQEIPLTSADFAIFGDSTEMLVNQLSDSGVLRRRPRGWFWTDQRRAVDLIDIRGADGGNVELIEGSTGRVIGTIDTARAHSGAHEGAVYVHRGETWLVDHLDLAERVAVMERAEPAYSTTAREITEIAIVAETEHETWGGCRLSFGQVDVSHQVVSYLKRRVPSGEIIAEEPLDLPVRTLRTTAVWWTVPPGALAASEIENADIPGAAHAAEHCSIGLLPLYATCDRWDIGGVSTAVHPDTGQLTVFVYDGHQGGAGFSERGYRSARTWLGATLATIESCECFEGCPSCIQSPKCGNGNNPLDKAGAIRLLRLLLSGS